MNYHDLILHPSFLPYLSRIDGDIALFFKKKGCPCGGVLDRADFRRKKGFGITEASGEEARRRDSFCCREDGCRCRLTPPSIRFLHGMWFASAVIVLLSAMQHGITPERRAQLQRQLGVSRQTIDRWRKWWQETFVPCEMWLVWRARCQLRDKEGLPDGLLRILRESAETPPHALVLVCTLIGCWRIADPTSIFTIVQGRLADDDFPQNMCADGTNGDG